MLLLLIDVKKLCYVGVSVGVFRLVVLLCSLL